jgi:deoxyadenosine/deoxycytidine kinase
MTKDLYKSNLVVYLLQKTEKLLSNINNRGREYEKDISKDYLDKINNAYINYLKNRQDLNIVFIDISDLDFVENHIDYLELLNRIKRKLR